MGKLQTEEFDDKGHLKTSGHFTVVDRMARRTNQLKEKGHDSVTPGTRREGTNTTPTDITTRTVLQRERRGRPVLECGRIKLNGHPRRKTPRQQAGIALPVPTAVWFLCSLLTASPSCRLAGLSHVRIRQHLLSLWLLPQ